MLGVRLPGRLGSHAISSLIINYPLYPRSALPSIEPLIVVGAASDVPSGRSRGRVATATATRSGVARLAECAPFGGGSAFMARKAVVARTGARVIPAGLAGGPSSGHR